jgi:hypothetical protein
MERPFPGRDARDRVPANPVRSRTAVTCPDRAQCTIRLPCPSSPPRARRAIPLPPVAGWLTRWNWGVSRSGSRCRVGGELPSGIDAQEVIRVAVAPVCYRLFITHEPVSAQLTGLPTGSEKPPVKVQMSVVCPSRDLLTKVAFLPWSVTVTRSQPSKSLVRW